VLEKVEKLKKCGSFVSESADCTKIEEEPKIKPSRYNSLYLLQSLSKQGFSNPLN
jgi:hypothetical protein